MSVRQHRIYYAVMQRGLPMGLYKTLALAEQFAKELSTGSAPAEVITVTPVQTDFDFEEPTNRDPFQGRSDCGCGAV